MRKTASIVFCFFLCFQLFAQKNPDEIIAKTAIVLGGQNNLKTIKTLVINSSIEFNMMSRTMDANVITIRDRGKYYRQQISGMMMGRGNAYTFMTDTVGYRYFPPSRGFGGGPGGGGEHGGPGGGGPGEGGNNSGGSAATLVKLNAEDLAKERYELDPEGPFASLINYKENGAQVSFAGNGKANSRSCFKILLKLKTGEEILYYIDTDNYLILQCEASAQMILKHIGMETVLTTMGAEVRKGTKVKMTFENYRPYNGILFPTKQKLRYGALDITVSNDAIQVNPPSDPSWYTVQSAN